MVEASQNYTNSLSMVDAVENNLQQQGSSIEIELQEQIDYYNQLLNDAIEESNEERQAKIISLIETTYELLAEYNEYSLMIKNLNSENEFNLMEITYNVVVSAAIGYFNMYDYVLSAELLTHARDNNDIYSTYEPEHGYLVAQSPKYDIIKSAQTEYGTITFSNGNTSVESDLHYALNAVEYRKTQSNSWIVIFDIYDFERNDNPQGLVDWVVNEIYNAQTAGDIIPYYVQIGATTGNATNLQTVNVSIDTLAEKRYYEDIAILVGHNYKEYSVTFEDGGMKLIQTFGPLDTRMYIYDDSNQLVAIDDDSGYGNNAAYWLESDECATYRIRIRCVYSNDSGATRFSITPAPRFKDNEAEALTTYEDIWTVTGITNYSLTAYAQRLRTAVIVYTPPIAGTYTLSLESSFDNYGYIIDPTTNRPIKEGYTNVGNYGANISITSKLKANIPYLIIFCQENVEDEFTDYTEGIRIIVRINKI